MPAPHHLCSACMACSQHTLPASPGHKAPDTCSWSACSCHSCGTCSGPPACASAAASRLPRCHQPTRQQTPAPPRAAWQLLPRQAAAARCRPAQGPAARRCLAHNGAPPPTANSIGVRSAGTCQHQGRPKQLTACCGAPTRCLLRAVRVRTSPASAAARGCAGCIVSCHVSTPSVTSLATSSFRLPHISCAWQASTCGWFCSTATRMQRGGRASPAPVLRTSFAPCSSIQLPGFPPLTCPGCCSLRQFAAQADRMVSSFLQSSLQEGRGSWAGRCRAAMHCHSWLKPPPGYVFNPQLYCSSSCLHCFSSRSTCKLRVLLLLHRAV